MILFNYKMIQAAPALLLERVSVTHRTHRSYIPLFACINWRHSAVAGLLSFFFYVSDRDSIENMLEVILQEREAKKTIAGQSIVIVN
jgi:hypothetical protein